MNGSIKSNTVVQENNIEQFINTLVCISSKIFDSLHLPFETQKQKVHYLRCHHL